MTLTWNVIRHLLAQVAGAAAIGAVTAIAHVDWSSLGQFGPLIAMGMSTVVAIVTSLVNEALGTAPAK